MNKQLNKSYLIKWLICGYLIFSNIGYLTGILYNLIKGILSLTEAAIWMYLAVTVTFTLIKLTVLGVLFFYIVNLPKGFLNHDRLKHSLLVNLILFPIFYILNMAFSFLQPLLLSRNKSIEFYGELTQYSTYVSIFESLLVTIMIVVFGIIAINLAKENQEELTV